MGGQEKGANGLTKDEVFSKSVRAGKRTYFFDVKSTKSSDQYLTITESKKIFDSENQFHFEKHKIFLYKEDFEKFIEGLSEAIGYISGDNIIASIAKIKEQAEEFSEVNYENYKD